MRIWLLTIFLVVLAAACISQNIEDMIKKNGDIINFTKTYPNSSLHIELVNNITAPSLYDEIFSVCPDVVDRLRYWKVFLSDTASNSSTTVWVKDDGLSVCKITVEGKVEVIEKRTETSATAPGTKPKDSACSGNPECSSNFCFNGFCADSTITTVNATANTTITTNPPGAGSVSVGGGGGGGSAGSSSGGGSPTTTVPGPNGPNLIPLIDNITFSSTELRVAYAIKNSGNQPATNASIGLSITNSTRAIWNCGWLGNLAAGETHPETCSAFPSMGYIFGNAYTVNATVDTLNEITETNENDNTVLRDVNTGSTTTTTTTTQPGQTTTSTSTTTTQATTTTTSPSSVDLEAFASFSSGAGRSISVSWQVRNLGSGAAGAFNIVIDFHNEATQALVDSCTSGQSSLAGGSLASGTCIKTMSSAGNFTARVNADPPSESSPSGQVAETTEGNNIVWQSFTFA